MRLTLRSRHVGFFAATLIVALALASTVAFAEETPANGVVTFTKNIAPILQDHCQGCHHAGTFAPMSLVTYEETRPWAKSIKQKVAAREMPPWFIDKNVGVQNFSNDISLTDAEIDTITKWVDDGAPQGNPADMPAAREFDDSASRIIGKPDLIVTLPKDVIVSANSPDQWPDVLVDPHLTEDRYINGVTIIPLKGFPLIHHIRTSIVEPSDATRHSGRTDATDGSLQVGEQGV